MKPQCETAAACLRELARVMEQFGIGNTVDAVNSKYIKYNGMSIGGHKWTDCPGFNNSKQWKFAIAEVEGKPVFIGDDLYYIGEYNPTKVTVAHNLTSGAWSWNPPKPKTVMVEMLVEDAEEWAKYSGVRCGHAASNRLYSICKKALEKQ